MAKKLKIKTNPSPKRQKSESVKTGEASDTRTMPDATLPDRGIGSSYAMSLGKLMEDAERQNRDSYLGVKSTIIDPKEYSHSLIKTKE